MTEIVDAASLIAETLEHEARMTNASWIGDLVAVRNHAARLADALERARETLGDVAAGLPQYDDKPARDIHERSAIDCLADIDRIARGETI